MEYIDAFSFFSAGLALGLIVGHRLSKQTLRLEYERGQLDGINRLWPHLVRTMLEQLHAKHRESARDTPAGSDRSPE